MSLSHRLLAAFWTAREERLDARSRGRASLARRRRSELRQQQVQLQQRVAELEDDLGRVTLLLRALADACVQKSVVTKDELAAIAQAVDAEDGTLDDKLDPGTLGGGDDVPPTTAPAP